MESKHENCVFCNTLVKPQSVPGFSGIEYRCVHCGNYVLDNKLRLLLSSPGCCYLDKKHLISGYLAETKSFRDYISSSREDNVERCFIDENRVKSILTDPILPKTVMQILDKLLIYLHKTTQCFGQEHQIDKIPISASYVHDKSELVAIISEAVSLNLGGYGEHREPGVGTYGYGANNTGQKDKDLNKNVFILSIKGHSRAEELLVTNIDSKKVFVAMGFKDDLLQAMNNSIRPACATCGFSAFLSSDKEHNNGITDEIIVAIKTSRFIITDFTYNNSGAYFEAGYAQGFGLEVIRCCKQEWLDGVDERGEKNKLHFDVNHFNFIFWKDEVDLELKLINRIRATIPGAIME